MIKNTLTALALAASIIALVLGINNQRAQHKTVYVEMGKIYEEFNLTKELNKELEKVLKARKLITDSLFEAFRRNTQEVKYKEKKSMEDIQKLAKLEEDYLYKKDLFEKDNQKVTTEYNNKIWNQLNQYLQDYGQTNELNFIFGANGQGNIMYGETSRNLTREVISYVNDRYNDQTRK